MLATGISQYLLLVLLIFTGTMDAVISYLNIVIGFTISIWALRKPFGRLLLI
jgi:hypothetical protein